MVIYEIYFKINKNSKLGNNIILNKYKIIYIR